MKISLRTAKYAFLALALCAGLAAQTYAVPMVTNLALFDTNELGFIDAGIPSGDQDRENYVNHLIGMALGSTGSAMGQNFTRSNNNFGPLSAAVWNSNGGTTTINLGTGGFMYLFAKYDGPNYGSEVWYIGGLTGTITIPAFGGQYALSGWTLFTPGAPSQSTPDGGTTVMLLGAALAGLGAAKRFFKS